MSVMLGRTLNFLSGLGAEPGWGVPSATERHSLPPSTKQWMEAVVACLTKQEEEEMAVKQLESLVSKLCQPGVKSSVLSDCLVRGMFLSLLGYDTSCLYMHCIKLAGAPRHLHRRMGYLGCSLMPSSSPQLPLLLTNCLLRELESRDVSDLCLGLTSLCSLVTGSLGTELLPLLVPRVQALQQHESPLVRRKVLACLHHLSSLSPSLWDSLRQGLGVALSDPHPGVALSALQVLSSTLSASDPIHWVASCLEGGLHLVTQLRQEGQKAPHGEYSKWADFYLASLLRRAQLSVFSGEYKELATRLKGFLQRCLERASKDRLCQATVLEAVIAVSVLQEQTELSNLALRQVSVMLSSPQTEVVYSGLVGLQAIFSCQPPCLSGEQERTVLACLSHQDLPIQRRTLELLLVLAQAPSSGRSNIVERVLNHLKQEGANRQELMLGGLLPRLAELIKAGDQALDWKAGALLRLLQLSRGEAREACCQVLKDLLCPLAKVEADPDPASELELNQVVEKLGSLLRGLAVGDSAKGPPVVAELFAWLQGQWGEGRVEEIMEVAALGEKYMLKGELGAVESCLWALSKLYNRNSCRESIDIHPFIQSCSVSEDVTLRSVASQVLALITMSHHLDTAATGTELDWSLGFLDKHVCESLVKGGRPYIPKSWRLSEIKSSLSEKPLVLMSSSLNVCSPRESVSSSATLPEEGQSQGAQLWTMEGRVEEKEESPASDKEREQSLPSLSSGTDLSSLASVLNEEWN